MITETLLIQNIQMDMNDYSCYHCKGQCIFTRADLVCTLCGTEQNMPIYETEWDVSDRVCKMDTLGESVFLKNKTAYYNNKHQNSDLVFETIKEKSCMPESVIDFARTMYNDYHNAENHMPIRGEKRRTEFACACLCYASKSLNSGALTQDEVVRRVLPFQTSIQWAIKELQRVLVSVPTYKTILANNTSKPTDSLSRITRIVSDEIATNELAKAKKKAAIPTPQASNDSGGHYKDILKLVYKLLQTVEKKDLKLCKLTHPEKLAASLVFMACKFLKKKITLKAIAILTNTSEPVILGIEKTVKQLVMGNKH